MLSLSDISFPSISPSSSSATDASFDAVIGCIEDIIMGIIFSFLFPVFAKYNVSFCSLDFSYFPNYIP